MKLNADLNEDKLAILAWFCLFLNLETESLTVMDRLVRPSS